MSNCEKYLDLISAYFDGEVTDAETAELEAHFEACEECRSILETYREMSAELIEDTEDVPEGFSAGVMDKVAAYEKNISARKQRKNLGIAGRWIGIAACIAIVLVAFPRMPNLGCGASKDAVMESTMSGSAMNDAASPQEDMFAGGTGAMPESSVDFSSSDSDGNAGDVTTDAAPESDEECHDTSAENKFDRAGVGMVVTLYGVEVPEELEASEYEVTYYENGDVEYIVPVSVARDIAAQYDNAEVEVLDADIEEMNARIIIKK
ncbi:MAG: zf-HC2 domain-containing protein [Oscillospiraceae bacterium]|nr:zf-HC2 domain-containing protein [Oscillospiraceae bacterium]